MSKLLLANKLKGKKVRKGEKVGGEREKEKDIRREEGKKFAFDSAFHRDFTLSAFADREGERGRERKRERGRDREKGGRREVCEI
jgi:hypothetical protein